MICLARVIPCLLVQGSGLVKTVRFERRTYIGDPVNAVRIFNEREVDELAILDIVATREGRAPDFGLIETIVSEAFMPVAYGGGIRTEEDIGRLFSIGVEKVIIATAAVESVGLLLRAARLFGNQSIVACLETRKSRCGGHEAYIRCGTRKLPESPLDIACRFVECGAGELLINSIDRDGTMSGYDLKLISDIAASVPVPVMACGGAGCLADARKAIDAGASAAVAGSMFVFHGKHHAVLINYPSPEQRAAAFRNNI